MMSSISTDKVTAYRFEYDNAKMLPSSHDITEDNVDAIIEVAKREIDNGSSILFVSKPRRKPMTKLYRELQEYSPKIIIRLTLTTMDEELRKFWEPGASRFPERFECLKLAYEAGYNTSVSSEPFLGEDIVDMYYTLEPYVRESHWIGKMSYQFPWKVWSDADKRYVHRLKDLQSNDNILVLYNALKDEPKVRWKDSIKKVIGIPLNTVAVMNI